MKGGLQFEFDDLTCKYNAFLSTSLFPTRLVVYDNGIAFTRIQTISSKSIVFLCFQEKIKSNTLDCAEFINKLTFGDNYLIIITNRATYRFSDLSESAIKKMIKYVNEHVIEN